MRAFVLLLILAGCHGDDTVGGPVTPISDDTASADDTGATDDTGGGDDTATDDTGGGDDTATDDTGGGDDTATDQPFLFRNTIDVAGEPSKKDLSAGGLEVYTDGNLGGNSLWSEVFSYELLYRCEGADLVKTEAEIDYTDDGGKKTDLLVSIDTHPVGVSVTRAYHYPPTEDYTMDDANDLLDRKLSDILLSAANADPADAWQRSMLHVIAYNEQSADTIEAAWAKLDSSVRDETIVIVTVSDGDDAFMY